MATADSKEYTPLLPASGDDMKSHYQHHPLMPSSREPAPMRLTTSEPLMTALNDSTIRHYTSDNKQGMTSRSSFSTDLYYQDDSPSSKSSPSRTILSKPLSFLLTFLFTFLFVLLFSFILKPNIATPNQNMQPTGPYRMVERQEGEEFFNHYEFFNGPDSVGSSGYNYYVGDERARELDIAHVSTESVTNPYLPRNSTQYGTQHEEEFVYLKSAKGITPEGKSGFRESIRLEGKTKFDGGLFIIDVRHMPVGCGVWPAFWLTDEEVWPDHGEIDIIEGVNYQDVAKTALHTRDGCSMYGHVSPFDMTGSWDSVTGVPKPFTGVPDYKTWKELDDCAADAPHQWYNQGCVTMDTNNTKKSLGKPLNDEGGGVFVLDWDPVKERAIRSWSFVGHDNLPDNLKDVLRTSRKKNKKLTPGLIPTAGEDQQTQRIEKESRKELEEEEEPVVPDPDSWGLPYGRFAVGEGTGCSADHFENMHLIFNIAFCGAVAGSTYLLDCPAQAKKFHVPYEWLKTENSTSESEDDGDDDGYDVGVYYAKYSSMASCNAWIQSDPEEMKEAYWKISGVYVFQREMEVVKEDETEVQ